MIELQMEECKMVEEISDEQGYINFEEIETE